MKIVVDARQISAKSSETGRYMEELVKRFPVLEPSWSWHFLFSDTAAQNRVLADIKNCCQGTEAQVSNISSEIIRPESNRLKNIFAPIRFLKKLHDLKCDLYFSPDSRVPRLGLGRQKYSKGNFVCVTAFQNIIHQLKSLPANSLKKQSMQISLRQAVKQSAAVIAQSATSRNDIIAELGLSDAEKSKIRTVYNGVSDVFIRNKKEFEHVGVNCRTIISVTNYAFDKDTDVLLKAFSKLIRDNGFADTRLVCIGPDDGNYAHIHETAANLGCGSKVSILTGLSQEDIAKACSESLVFVNPTSYEDFGQTIVDAMACGLPVICCNNGAQGEIVMDATVKIPADDIQALADSLKYVISDTKKRKSLSERGIKRAAELSWNATAESIVAIFREILTVNGDKK